MDADVFDHITRHVSRRGMLAAVSVLLSGTVSRPARAQLTCGGVSGPKEQLTCATDSDCDPGCLCVTIITIKDHRRPRGKHRRPLNNRRRRNRRTSRQACIPA